MTGKPVLSAARPARVVRLAALAALALATAAASASFVEIAWDGDGGFEHSSAIEAGGVAEICGLLSAGEQVEWAFEAGAPLDFNIHYHEGDEVVYPQQLAATAASVGVLEAPVDQAYCWMWSNAADQSVAFSLRLSKRP